MPRRRLVVVRWMLVYVRIYPFPFLCRVRDRKLHILQYEYNVVMKVVAKEYVWRLRSREEGWGLNEFWIWSNGRVRVGWKASNSICKRIRFYDLFLWKSIIDYYGNRLSIIIEIGNRIDFDRITFLSNLDSDFKKELERVICHRLNSNSKNDHIFELNRLNVIPFYQYFENNRYNRSSICVQFYPKQDRQLGEFSGV